LALMLAGLDKRVDAIVPMITWNDLARSFLPEATGKSPVDGVFKKQWAGIFFGNTLGRDPQCGRFAEDICKAYLSIAATGRANPDAVALLRKSSPATVLADIKAPTLLIQGEIDSLFPLSEADANARGIAATGTPVRVAWFTGGHDGGTGPQSEVDRLHFLTAQWLDHYLKGNGSAPSGSFTYSRIAGLNAQGRGYVTTGYSVPDYPGSPSTQTIEVRGPPQPIANPPGGNPAAVSTVAGGNSLASVVNGRFSTEVPGQHADFYSEPLDHAVDVVGSPQVRVKSSGDAESPEARRSGPSAGSGAAGAVLFVKLYDVGPDGATLPNGLIAPIRVTGGEPVTVTLPPIVYRFEAGHRLGITVATSDQGYATPADPALYTVSVDPAVTLPSIPGTPIANPNVVWRCVLLGLLVVLAAGLAAALVVARRRGRRVVRRVDAELVDTPLVVRNLRKQ